MRNFRHLFDTIIWTGVHCGRVQWSDTFLASLCHPRVLTHLHWFMYKDSSRCIYWNNCGNVRDYLDYKDIVWTFSFGQKKVVLMCDNPSGDETRPIKRHQSWSIISLLSMMGKARFLPQHTMYTPLNDTFSDILTCYLNLLFNCQHFQRYFDKESLLGLLKYHLSIHEDGDQ